MLARARSRLTFANAVSCLALFVALGGSAVALDVVPFAKEAGFAKKAGKAKKAKAAGKVDGLSASKTPKKNKLLALNNTAKFPAAVLPEGFTGPQGATGPIGATGPAGPLLETLPSGKTLLGTWALGDVSGAAFTHAAVTEVTFQFPLASEPVAHLISTGEADPNCPGSAAAPTAAPGHFCIYEAIGTAGGATSKSVYKADDSNGASRFGANILYISTVNDLYGRGGWAVTAP
ncbi:MAG TPA: hypothetical protein VD790_01350 [Thermoleophilaceae bacterium]|nr:hypothetical protein [Thermoleophilaceae bacterium]